MPNTGRITKCPYYRDEKNLSISCEDTFRRFRWPAQKNNWMDKYCDDNWQACEYAKELEGLYDEMGGNEMSNKILELEHENAALKKELRKVSSMLGKATKREERKDDRIRELMTQNRALEKVMLREKQKCADLKLKLDKAGKDMIALADIYEGRIAYLVANFTDGTLNEEDIRKWAESFEYAMIPEATEKGPDGKEVVVLWRVMTREIEDDAHQSRGSSSEVSQAGGGTAEKTGREVEIGKTEAEEI